MKASHLWLTGSAAALLCVTASTTVTAAESASASESFGLEEIVVTAQRREETAQRAALAIQVVSAEALQRAGVAKPEDLNAVAPSLTIATGATTPQAYLRGVGNYSTSVYSEGAVSWNLDGIYLSRQWATRGAMFDLERVEVVKGPQGTLYGRNASGGAINLITARPRLNETSGYVEAEVGNYDLVREAGAVNLPVGDTVALRAAGQVTRRDGYTSDGYDDDKSESARLHALFQPSKDFSLLLTGNYQHVGGQGPGTVLMPKLPGSAWRGASDPAITAIPAAEPFIGSLFFPAGTDGFLKINLSAVNAELNWNFGPATLTVLPAYRSATKDNRLYVSSFQFNESEYNHQSSLETRLSNQSDRLKWVVGAYYFDENIGNRTGKPSLASTAGINGQLNPAFNSNTTSDALFGQGTLSLTDTFRLTVGGRYTYERKTQGGVVEAFNPSIFGPCAPPYALDPTGPIPLAQCAYEFALGGKVTYNSGTYKLGFEQDLAPQSMLYGNISTGFKSGGFYFAGPPNNSFKPEKLTAFQIGSKNRFLDNRLQANVELFYWLYRDHQESHLGPTDVPGYFTIVTENAGKAKSYGIDFDGAFQATEADRINFAVQYNKSKYDSFTYNYPTNPAAGLAPPVVGCEVVGPPTSTQTVDCSGKPMVHAPEWIGSAGYEHTFTLANGAAIIAGANGQFASGSYLSIDFLKTEYQPSFTMLNADLTFRMPSGKLSLTAWGRNLTNEAVYTQSFRSPFVSNAPTNPLASNEGYVLGSIRPPRTYGLRARIDF